MKIFKWFIGIKIKHIDADKRIAWLTNKLLNELVKNGYSIKTTTNPATHLSVWINAHKHESWELRISNTMQNWEIRDSYTGRVK